jgi:hypothetical protein
MLIIIGDWRAENRAHLYIGSVLLVLSILFSSNFRQFLSHPIPLFFGSISFGMYLLHTMFIRTLLAWIQLGFAQPHSAEIPVEGDGNVQPSISMIREVVRVGLCILWGVSLVFASRLWRDHIEKWCVQAAKFSEEVLRGNRELRWPLGNKGIQYASYGWLSNGALADETEQEVSRLGEKV